MQRKDAILRAAADHFGRFGFRGTSLRYIARDAGVSLTLLNHYFGRKVDILSAVIDAHRALLEERSDTLRRLTVAGAGTFAARELVHEWVRIGFRAAAEPDGELFVRVLARVFDDPIEEEVVGRERLDESALLFMDALHLCYPHATRAAIASAYLWVSTSLQNSLAGAHRVFRLANAQISHGCVDEDGLARLTRFLVGGIEAALGHSADPAAGPADFGRAANQEVLQDGDGIPALVHGD